MTRAGVPSLAAKDLAAKEEGAGTEVSELLVGLIGDFPAPNQSALLRAFLGRRRLGLTCNY